MDLEPRYAKITARSSCSACGQPVPLTTLDEQVTCPYCQAPNEIQRASWQLIALAADQACDYDESDESKLSEGAREVVYTVGRGAPACEKCNQPLPVAALSVGSRQNFACTSCGDPASTEPVPPWLASHVSPARQLYSLDPKQDAPGHATLGTQEAAAKPIIMSCPRCNGGLEITVQSERLLACKYCSAEVYLPDVVWRRLHPIKQVLPFYLRFDGPSIERRKRDHSVRAAAEEQEALDQRMREQAARREHEAYERSQKAAAAKSVAWAAVLAFGASLGITALASWVIFAAGGAPDIVKVAMAVVLGVVLLATTALVTRPIQIATKRPFDWVLFVTWFWLPFVLVFPVIGQVIALVRALSLWSGKFSASTITSGGSRTSYGALELEAGESAPAALFFLCIATLWPLALLPVVVPDVAAQVVAVFR